MAILEEGDRKEKTNPFMSYRRNINEYISNRKDT